MHATVPAPRQKTLPIVLDQYVEDAAALWSLRTAMANAPHVTLDHLARFDDRLEASLHGIAIAGPDGVRACIERLDKPGAGEIFVATVRAIETRDDDLLDRLFAVTGAMPTTKRGLWSALGWVPPGRLSGMVVDLLGASDPARILAGVIACTMHRVDPGAHIQRLACHADTAVRGRVMRLIGEAALMQHRPLLDAAIDAPESPVAIEAARSAVLLGDRGRALERLETACRSAGSSNTRAWKVAMRALPPERANALLRSMVGDPQCLRELIVRTGMSGDPRTLPWLIDRMNEDAVARVAGEAFAVITGIDMIDGDFGRETPPATDAGPNDDPADHQVAMDPDEYLPWPDAGKVAKWLESNAARFVSGTRYFLGDTIEPVAIDRALRTGYQRQRRAAALHRMLMRRGALFDVRAVSRRQQRALAQHGG